VAKDTPETADTLPADGEADPTEMPRGTSLGRYLILEKVGAGGMGVVYAAYDPKLDRRIALKALRSNTGRDEAARARLVREAKAMARLSHPHVVTVYDVVVEDQQVLVAMELVEGRSLRAWLDAKERSVLEIVGAFVQAGRGLAAAHDAGMVHRDVKLDNILVGGDGRVRIGDFGLARSSAPVTGPRVRHTPSGADALGPLVSREGILAGTPQYMAPDQLYGEPADALSDQFSFCAALYEALYFERPYEAATLEELGRAMEEERMQPAPAGNDVPGWLRAVLVRGLRARPQDRWPNMHALLAALEVDPRAARRRWIVAGVVGVGLLGAGALVARHRNAEAQACLAVERRLDGVWDERARRVVHDAFATTKRPYAEDTFVRVAKVLDEHAEAWAKQAVASCRERTGAPAASGPPSLAEQRASCLEDRFGELRAFSAVLARAEGETVDRAVQGARALPGLDVCAGKDPLGGRAWPADPAVRKEAEQLEDRMNDASALRAAGRYAEGTAAATKNLADAERIGFRPFVAAAQLALAEVQEEGGDLPGAEQSYHRASLSAEAVGEARVAALAWMGEAKRASERGEFASADDRFDHASAWVDRVGDDERLRAKLMLDRGERLSEQGKYDDARALQLKALAILERLGDDEATRALNDLGVDADLQLKYDEARDYYRKAMARYEQILGPDHPKIARELNNLGLMAGDQGKFDEAIAALEKANAIRAHALGPDHPEVAIGLNNLAFVYIAVERFADALALAERAVHIVEKQYGPDSSEMAFTLTAITGGLFGLHRYAETVEPAERELAIRERGGASVNLADAQCDLGKALLWSGKDPARGRELLKTARETFVKMGKSTRNAEIEDALKGPPAPK
jgi:serine/threonine-protein kinase